MTDLEGSVVEFEFADRVLVGRVTDTRQEASIATGPVSVFNIDVPGAGTYDVPEGDIISV